MKTSIKALIAASFIAGVSFPAYSADVYSSGSTKDPVTGLVSAPVATWTGFYVGANVGYADAWSRDNNAATLATSGTWGPSAGTAITASDLKQGAPSGVFGGGQAGYNYQHGNFVFGVETDIQGGGIDGSATTDISSLGASYGGRTGTLTIPTNATLSLTTKQSIDWFGTVRARLGFAFDKFLVYGTGGLAYGEVKDELGGTFTQGVNSVTGAVSHDETRIGYAAGGGVEYKLGTNWSAGFEYLHVDFGSAAISSPVSVVFPGNTTATKLGTITTDSIRSDLDTFKVKINYHF
jgi:outer membrane immunogenic protein